MHPEAKRLTTKYQASKMFAPLYQIRICVRLVGAQAPKTYEQNSFNQFPAKGRNGCLLLDSDSGIGVGAGSDGT